jgi:hypothetical protein
MCVGSHLAMYRKWLILVQSGVLLPTGMIASLMVSEQSERFILVSELQLRYLQK